jgi:hypothetical protein
MPTLKGSLDTVIKPENKHRLHDVYMIIPFPTNKLYVTPEKVDERGKELVILLAKRLSYLGQSSRLAYADLNCAWAITVVILSNVNNATENTI